MNAETIQATLNAAEKGQVLRLTTRGYGQTLTRTVIVDRITRYRGTRRLRIRCADGIFTGTSVIPVKGAGENPSQGIVGVEFIPTH